PSPKMSAAATGKRSSTTSMTALNIAPPALTRCAMSSAEIAAKYERAIIEKLILENAVEMAMAYMNLGEVEKAQALLQGALLDSQLSTAKGAANVRSTATA